MDPEGRVAGLSLALTRNLNLNDPGIKTSSQLRPGRFRPTSLDPKVDFAADQRKSVHGIVLWVLHPGLWSRDDLCITGGSVID